MEFLGRIFEFVLFVALVVWFSRKIADWRSGIGMGRSRRTGAAPPPESRPLHRDAWCGTYVSAEISRKLQQENQTLHFCSDECLARYVASQRRAARA